MKRFFLLMAILFAPALAWGQQTVVTATVIDPNGVPYAFLTGNASINCPGNQAPLFNGYTVPRTISIVGGNGNGQFTMTLYDINAITPTGCSYNFAITAQNGITNFIATGVGASGSATPITGAGPVNLSVAISAFAVLLPGSGTITVTAKVNCTGVAGNLPSAGCNGGSGTLYAVPSGGSGMYEVSCYTVLTQAASSTSTLPSCQITFTDSDTGTTLVGDTIGLTCTNTGNTLGETGIGATFCSGPVGIVNVVTFNAAASSNITFATGSYASSGATPMQYAVHLRLRYLGQ